MKRRIWVMTWAALLSGSLPAPASSAPGASALRPPLAFEQNLGQTARTVDYLVRGPGYVLWLEDGDAVMRLRDKPLHATPQGDADARPSMASTTVLRWRMRDAAKAEVEAEQALPGSSHYLPLDDSAAIRDARHYGRVRYRNLWPDIDLVYYGSADGQLEYDFVVAPGGDPARIGYSIEGASRLTLQSSGELMIETPAGTLTQSAPLIYQDRAGGRESVPGHFVLDDDQVRIAVGAYDATRELVIDPVLVWSSFLGGNGDDQSYDVAERNGEVYVTGRTLSTNFPTTAGALQVGAGGGSDCYISKFAAGGASLLYSTYLGGSGDQYCNAIAVGSDGSAYVAGVLPSSSGDAFLAKLNAAGSALAYPTVLRAGTGRDEAVAIEVSGGVATVVGYTDSTDFPTTAGVAQTSDGAGRGAFAFRVTAAGAVQWSTYLDGGGDQIAYGVAVDGGNNAYVAGSTTESDPVGDGFVIKLNSTGGAVYTGARVAGNAVDVILDLAVDSASGEAYVTGHTDSSNLPTTPGALQSFSSGDRDAFLGKINAAGNGFVFLTYLGGPRVQSGSAIARDGAGQIYVAGRSEIADVSGDAFLLKTGPEASHVHYNLQYGGAAADSANGLTVAGNGDAWVSGTTSSADFPTTPGAFDVVKGTAMDAFVFKVGPQSTTQTLVSTVSVAGTSVGPNGADTAPAVTLQPGDLVTVEAIGGSVNFNTSAAPCDASAYTVGLAGHPTSSPPIYAFSLCWSADAQHLPDPVPNADGYGHAGLFRPAQTGIGAIRFIGQGSETFTYSGASNTTLKLGVNDQPGTSNGGQFSVRVTIVRGSAPLNISMLSVDAPSRLEGNSGSANLRYTVTLAPANTQTVSVLAKTSDRTALAGSDYNAVSQTLTFAPGETTKTVDVPVLGDGTIEPDERFSLELVNPANASTAIPRGIGTIVSDDLPALSVNDVSVAEGDSGSGNANFNVSLTPAVSFPVAVSAYTSNASATAGSDYTQTSVTLNFAPGETSKPIAVAVSGDDAAETDETFLVNLSNASAATLDDAQGVGTIQNDDFIGNLGFASVAVSIDETQAGPASIAVTREAGNDGTVTVQYAIANGTANTPGDWNAVASSGTLTFNDGETQKFVQINIVDDTLDEADETIIFTLSSPGGGATLRNSTSTVSIIDNDAQPTLSVDNNGCTVVEGNTGSVNCNFVFRLSAVSGRSVLFTTNTGGGSAGASDFTGQGNIPRMISPGQTTTTVAVQVLGDTLDEDVESFGLNVFGVVNATAGGFALTGSINDDDSAPALNVTGCTASEGDVGLSYCNFTYTLAAASGKTVTLSYHTEPSDNRAGLVPNSPHASFESPALAGLAQTFVAGQSFSGWQVVAGEVDLVKDSHWQVAHGHQSIDLNGNSPGVLAKVVPTNAGATYEIGFALAGNYFVGGFGCVGPIRQLEVYWNNQSLGQLSFDTTGHSAGDMGYRYERFLAYAPSTTSTLRLQSLTGGSCGAVIDDVTIADVASATSGVDYQAQTATASLNFAPGETIKTVAVGVLGDNRGESTEGLLLVTDTATNAAATPTDSAGVILDDDLSDVIFEYGFE